MNRPPTEAALPPVTSPFDVLREPYPLFGHSQPRFLVCRSNRAIGLKLAFYCLRSEPSDVLVGHAFDLAVVPASINTYFGGRRPASHRHVSFVATATLKADSK